MQIKVDEISKLIRQQIEDYDKTTDMSEVGTVISVGDGIGRIYGLEFLLRKPLGDNFFGWLSYTLMKSERRTDENAPFIRFDFDQTHILTLIGSYRLPYNWQIGARFRLVSGNPFTPVEDSAFDAATGETTPILGPENSARLPVFHQLDLRVDKTWNYRALRVTAYLDIQNVYNAKNVEFINYSYDFRDSVPLLSLPTAPSIGFKLEF